MSSEILMEGWWGRKLRRGQPNSVTAACTQVLSRDIGYQEGSRIFGPRYQINALSCVSIEAAASKNI